MNQNNKKAYNNKGKHTGSAFLIVAIAVVIVAVLSLIPWGRLTDNFLKDYDLLSDIFPGLTVSTANEQIDPELLEAMNQGEAEEVTNPKDNATSPNASALPSAQQIKPVQKSRSGDKVIIEDYTIAGQGPVNLRKAMQRNKARIAMIGDSYIEGDIFSADLRKSLQDSYGGGGVGYMYTTSEITGFRTSVGLKCAGWTAHDIRKSKDDKYKWLSGEYFTAGSGATATFTGSKKWAHLDSWNNTQVLLIASCEGSVTIETDCQQQTFQVEPSPQVQAFSVACNTAKATVKCSQGLQVLGVFLDGNTGVNVDNMSLRGNSGISHRKLNADLAQDMRRFIDYDMIIVEYGINALSSQQTDYTAYKNLMVKTLAKLKECYPNADILLLAIGDRGQKVGATISSISTAGNMIAAQRQAAREAGVLFWDTREAMGGDDAVVSWREQGLINPDYIHLNAKGGKVLGNLLAEAIKNAL